MFSYFTPTFICLFLPLTMIVYELFPQRFRWAVLLAASYAFVLLVSKHLAIFLVVTVAITYVFGRALGIQLEHRDARLAEEPQSKRDILAACKKRMNALLAGGIIINFSILIALKYLGFLGEIVSAVCALLGFDVMLVVPRIGVTIGISFYTLMAVSYLVDVFREMVPVDRNPLRIALFLGFFPQIMEGPICRYDQTATALWSGAPITRESFYRGTLRIVVGFAKKFIVANRLELFVKPVFDHYQNYDGGIVALAAIAYTIQLYFDFSGCMDVALGTGTIFGVKLPENFRQPLLSKTASEFWQRWHITLGTWFKDYIYYPVSLSAPMRTLTKKARKAFGNRYGPMLTGSIALFCVWFANGLWHGAGSQYLFFGMYYFVLILAGGLIDPVAHTLAQKLGVNRESLPYRVFRIARTLLVIFVGELFFRANGLDAGLTMFGQIATGFTLDSLASGAAFHIGMDGADWLIAALFVLLVFANNIAQEHGHDSLAFFAGKGTIVRWAAWIALFLAIVVFGAYGLGYVPVNPMYAQF